MGKKHDKKIESQEIQPENQLKRALADYQNLEKRIAEERSNWIRSANRDLIIRLLPGLDSLLLAEEHTKDPGVKLSIKHFIDNLEAEGVRKIETKNALFDPNFMEAVSTKMVDPSTSPGQEEGKVVEEIKAGYTLNGEVIRPAQVVVGKS